MPGTSRRALRFSAAAITCIVVLVATAALLGVRLPAPTVETTQAGDLVPYDHADRGHGSRVAATGTELVDDTTVRVSFDAAVQNSRSCDRFSSTVVEDGDAVWFVIKSHQIENAAWFNCDVDEHETQTILLDLQQPLGERRLIDAAVPSVNDNDDEIPVDYLSSSNPLEWEDYEVINETTIVLNSNRRASGPYLACQRHEVQVEYTDDEIIVALHEGKLPHAKQLCPIPKGRALLDISMRTPFTLIVELDEPIGNREIVQPDGLPRLG